MNKIMQFTSFKMALKATDLAHNAFLVNYTMVVDEPLVITLLFYVFSKYYHKTFCITRHGRYAIHPIHPSNPSIQRFFRFNPLRIHVFFTTIKMSYPRMQIVSVFMEKRFSPNSKFKDKDRIKISICPESLISIDSSTATKNTLAFLLTFVCKKRDNCLAISPCRGCMVTRE